MSAWHTHGMAVRNTHVEKYGTGIISFHNYPKICKTQPNYAVLPLPPVAALYTVLQRIRGISATHWCEPITAMSRKALSMNRYS